MGKRSRGRPRTKSVPILIEKKTRNSLKAIANWSAKYLFKFIKSECQNQELYEKTERNGISYVTVQHTCINEIFGRSIVKI